jgi:hypothetical protein
MRTFPPVSIQQGSIPVLYIGNTVPPSPPKDQPMLFGEENMRRGQRKKGQQENKDRGELKLYNKKIFK